MCIDIKTFTNGFGKIQITASFGNNVDFFRQCFYDIKH